MRRSLSTALLMVPTMLLTTVVTATPAAAATGSVVVFSIDELPLDVYKNPTGCKKLPIAAHVLANLTNRDVYVHGDPTCLTPGLPVPADHGVHVPPGTGAFFVR